MINNLIIAKFMGSIDEIGRCSISSKSEIWLPNHGLLSKTSLKYHKSWDWLMPVVIKINNLNPLQDMVICGGRVIFKDYTVKGIFYDDVIDICHNKDCNNEIDVVYKSVVLYINWYNSLANEIKEKLKV